MTLGRSREVWMSGLLIAGSSILLVPGITNAATLLGPLYKLSSSTTVYVAHNGSLHAIASPTMLFDLGYTWKDVATVTTLPDPIGPSVSLLKPRSGSKVYLYQDGQMHWITNEQVFKQNGYQWDNVYGVSSLPAPIGSSITSTSSAASFVSLSAFPYIPAGGTKTIAIDALNTNGAIDTSYNGTLTVSNSTDNLTLKDSTGTYGHGPITISFVKGIGIVTVGAGTKIGSAVLQAGPKQLLNLTIRPNTTAQIGWRVFTSAGVPVTSLDPVTSSDGLLVEPVDVAGTIVPATMADNVSLFPDTNAPGYQSYISYLPFPPAPPLTTVYASSSAPSFTFTGSYGGMDLGENLAYPITFLISPDSPANVKVTNVIGASSNSAPVVSNPVSNNIGQIQLVNGIQADQTYSIQLQLETNTGQPILGIPALFKNGAYPTTASPGQSPTFNVSTSARTTPSTLTFGHFGASHVYLTYHTGSANNLPDILSLYGTQNEQLYGPGLGYTPIVQLVTNAF